MSKLEKFYDLISRNASVTIHGSEPNTIYFKGKFRSIPHGFDDCEVVDFSISPEGNFSFIIANCDFFTTIEKLQCKVSKSCGAVLEYGKKVFVADYRHPGDFIAEIYEFVDDPEETGLGDIECRLNLIKTAEQRFKDNGHAIEWCLKQKN